jgi:hypothetical protein
VTDRGVGDRSQQRRLAGARWSLQQQVAGSHQPGDDELGLPAAPDYATIERGERALAEHCLVKHCLIRCCSLSLHSG